MIVLKLILAIIWFFIIPFFTGKLVVKENEKDRKLFSWLIGWMLGMAIFYVVAIIMILLKMKFSLLCIVYSTIMILIFGFSLIKNRKNIKSYIYTKEEIINVFKNISIFQVILIVLLAGLLFVRIKYTSINDDDSSFVYLSGQMMKTDRMFLYKSGAFMERRALAPISAYYAMISKIIGIHPTIVTHSIMPIVWYLLAFLLYYYISKELFKDKDSSSIFLILLTLLCIFSFSVKGVNRYFLLYTWFGRAILGIIGLPFIWKEACSAMSKDANKIIDWVRIFILVVANLLLTEMSIALNSISLGSLALIFSIKDKKISYILKSIVCIIPCMIIAALYWHLLT